MANNNKTYVSKAKLKELSEELDFLKTDKRKDVAEKLEYAKSLGDLSENAEYQEARENQASVEKRILELEVLLSNAEIVEKHHSSVVGVGSIVVVQKVGAKTESKYFIVGSEEADVATSKLSNISPFGEALMGGKKGDRVSFESPSGEMKYKIINIE